MKVNLAVVYQPLVTNLGKQRDVTTRFLDPVSGPFLEHKLSVFWPKNHPTLSFFEIKKKAFDTVDHAIILKKLEHGIRGTENKWFESYLSGRQQYISQWS